MVQVDIVIATLFHPPTLEPLVASAEKQGATVHVIEGKRVNVAWNEGRQKSKASHVCILNDDIIMEPEDDWLGRIAARHDEGYTHVTPIMFGEKAGESGEKKLERQPRHRGHAFSISKSMAPPIPSKLEISFGDDWHFLWHLEVGRPCVITDVQYKTGEDAGFVGRCSWTLEHPKIHDFLGEGRRMIYLREMEEARKYFRFRPGRGAPVGLRPELVAHAFKETA